MEKQPTFLILLSWWGHKSHHPSPWGHLRGQSMCPHVMAGAEKSSPHPLGSPEWPGMCHGLTLTHMIFAEWDPIFPSTLNCFAACSAYDFCPTGKLADLLHEKAVKGRRAAAVRNQAIAPQIHALRGRAVVLRAWWLLLTGNVGPTSVASHLSAGREESPKYCWSFVHNLETFYRLPNTNFTKTCWSCENGESIRQLRHDYSLGFVAALTRNIFKIKFSIIFDNAWQIAHDWSTVSLRSCDI